MKSSTEKILNIVNEKNEQNYSRRFKALCMLVMYALSFSPFLYAEDDRNVISTSIQPLVSVSLNSIEEKNTEVLENVKEEENFQTHEFFSEDKQNVFTEKEHDIVALNSSADKNLPEAEIPLEAKMLITKKEGGVVKLGKTEIEIPAGAVKKDIEITIERLENVKETGESIANVTELNGGYRFLPAGTKFKKDVIVSIPYDKELNSKPESLEETYTYFYDIKKEMWIALERIEIDRENCLIKSKTKHFTDMINATLTMPETASPSEVNLNKIKNLEAARADGHLVKFNSPQASNTGDAAFSFELDVAPGRRGLSPQLAVSYSSANGNGLMGKGFDLICNDSIVTDTRMGLPKYDGRDTYLKDGIILECTDNKQHSYVPKREASYSKIERFNAGSEDDYWKVTEKNGLVKVYGKYIQYKNVENNSVVKGLDKNKNEKAYIWNLTELSDTYGNSILYKYREDKGSVYLDEIVYTGKDGKEGKYFVSFEYYDGDEERELRKDGRIDARSGKIIESNYLLKSIKTGYDKETVRTYEFIYGERTAASEKYLKEFKVWNKENKESYSYFFDYNELDLNNMFDSPVKYDEFDNPVQTGVSKSTAINGSVSGGAGVGRSGYDVRVTGGAQGSVSTSTSYSDDIIADMDGDGRPDSIHYDLNEPEKLFVNLQGDKKWTIDCSAFSEDQELELEKGSGDTGGFTVYGGAGKKGKINVSLGISYAKVKQNGSSRVLKTVADMDGDGRPDIVQSDQSFYLKNNGDGTFTKTYIIATTDAPVKDYQRKLESEDVEGYKNTYRQQLPFRIWKAPYNGKIKIKNEGKFISGNNRKEQIILKTFIGEKSECENKLSLAIDSDNLKKAEDNDLRTITQNSNIYFGIDAGPDPENADLIFKNSIEYESIQIFNDMNELPVFLPEKQVKYDRDNSFNIQGVSEFELKTGYPEVCYESESVNENYNQNTGYAHWVVIGTLKDDWQELLTDEIKSISFASKLIEEKRVIPRYFTSDFFEKTVETVYNQYSFPKLSNPFYTDEQLDELNTADKVSYLEKFVERFKYDVTKDLYEYVSMGYESDLAFLTKYLSKIDFKGYLTSYYNEEKYETENIKAVISTGGIIYRAVLGSDNHDKERTRDVTGAFYDLDYMYLGTICGERLVLNNKDKKVFLGEEEICEAEVKEEDGSLEIAFNIYEKYKMLYKMNDAEKTADKITESEVLKIIETYKAEGQNEGETSEEEAEALMRNAFEKYYDESAHGYTLRDEWKKEKTQEDFTTEDENGETVEDKEAYQEYLNELDELKKLCVKFSLVKYNECIFNLTYINNAEYKIENKKCSFLSLDKNELELDYSYFEIVKNTWNSFDDFENDNRSVPRQVFANYEYYITSVKEGKKYRNVLTSLPLDVNDGEEESERQVIEVACDESYYGGCNQWYYGIWNGKGKFNSSALNPVKGKNLEEMQKQIEDENSKISETDEENLEDFKAEERETDEIIYYVPKKNVSTQNSGTEISEEKYNADYMAYVKSDVNNILIGNISAVSVIKGKDLETQYYAPFIYKDFIHCDRYGGTAFYDIEGMDAYLKGKNQDAGSINEKEGDVTLKLGEIRRSKSSGDDVTKGFEFVMAAERSLPKMLEKISKLEEIFLTGSSLDSGKLGISGNIGTNESSSYTVKSFQDINGDGIPDILYSDGKGITVRPSLKKKTDTGYKIVYDREVEYKNAEYISQNTSIVETKGASFSAQGSVSTKYTAGGRFLGAYCAASMSGSGGGSKSSGDSYQSAGMTDINGDGLPDYFYDGKFKLNNGYDFEEYQPEGIFTKEFLNHCVNEGFGVNIPIGSVSTKSESMSNAVVSAGGALNIGFSGTRIDGMFMDLNGDGLADYVYKEDGKWMASFNNGKGLNEAVEFKIPEWKFADGDKTKLFKNADNAFDVGLISKIPYVGDAVSESVTYVATLNAYAINPDFYNALDLSTTITLGISGTLGSSFTVGIPIPVTPLQINITASASGGVGASSAINGVTVRMFDIDGDGYVDQVMRIPGTVTVGEASLKTGKIYYKKNLSGKAGLLKTITTPQGGTVDIDYEGIYGTKDMPYHKYVMKSVTVDDGTGKILPEVVVKENDNVEPDTHSITVNYTYENARYDRTEKEFYGFEKVTSENPDGTKQLTVYNNNPAFYHLKGTVKETVSYSKIGKELSLSKTEYDLNGKSALPVSETVTAKEEDCDSYIEVKTTYDYDDYGNVIRLIQTTNNANDKPVCALIDYEYKDSSYIMCNPVSIEVYDRIMQPGESSKDFLRKRCGSYTDEGSLKTLRQYYTESDYTETKIEYDDDYGLITKVTGARGEEVLYGYDSLKMFVTSVRQKDENNSYLTSTVEYDVITGTVKKETDCRGYSFEYEYDKWQRLEKLKTPYDTGRLSAVEYEYFTPVTQEDESEGGTAPENVAAALRTYKTHPFWHAVTKNKVSFDAADTKTIETVVLTDGLGEAVLTAKTGVVYKNGNKEKGWNVSGAVIKDEKMRVKKTGQVYFAGAEQINFESDDVLNLKLIYPAVNFYDEKGRVTTTVMPWENGETITQTTEYRIENECAVITVTDPEGNKTEQILDARENILEVSRFDASGIKLTSSEYQYNILGELKKALTHVLGDSSAKDSTVEAVYDKLGRKTEITTTDGGTYYFEYDKSSNVTARSNSRLLNEGRKINFIYDSLNRLTEKNYEDKNGVPFVTKFTYGKSGSGDPAGLLVKVTDETGVIEYTYGKLSEIKKEKRVMKQHDVNGKDIEAVMEYESNYLGQMEKMKYPDGEEITYVYDDAGQICAISGTNGDYVDDIGYDETGSRIYIKYANGVETNYDYRKETRLLEAIKTKKDTKLYQNISYSFTKSGNIKGYTNDCLSGYGTASGNYRTSQSYEYDGLYQLTKVNGTTELNRHGFTNPEVLSKYEQNFSFDSMGNMTEKKSKENVLTGSKKGDDLNYEFDYEIEEGYSHRYSRIGPRYYKYDQTGNIIMEQDAPFSDDDTTYTKVEKLNDKTYGMDEGWGYFSDANSDDNTGGISKKKINRRTYEWNAENQLTGTTDESLTVNYTYGADGKRASKYTHSSETLYFNDYWVWHIDSATRSRGGKVTKNIYLGTERLASRIGSYNTYYGEEKESTFFYHSDHLGSAQLVTDCDGNEYQRLEYTPYGETWMDLKAETSLITKLPYRFSAKELDEETGLYYYGARYLDPKMSRWISADPAMNTGEYFPVAPTSEDARRYNGNLPGMGGIFNHINFHLYHYAANNPVRYTDPMGRNTFIAINPKEPFACLSHGGLAVETGDGKWSFFEFNDTDNEMPSEDLVVPIKCDPDSKYSKEILSSKKIVFPGEKLRKALKYNTESAGCMKYDFETKEDLLYYLDSRGFEYTVELKTDADTDKKIYDNAVAIGKNLDGYILGVNDCNVYMKRVYESSGLNNFLMYHPYLSGFALMPRGYAHCMRWQHLFTSKKRSIECQLKKN